jgi:phosphoribosyl 1,2-cyclic phosphate phosphodiesterase
MSDVPEVSFPLLEDLDLLVIDALRYEPHPSHSHIENSLAIVDRLKPRRALFTHMSHDVDHDATNAALPPYVRLAYDGMQTTFEIA